MHTVMNMITCLNKKYNLWLKIEYEVREVTGPHLYYFWDKLIKILIIKIYNLLQHPMIYKQARSVVCLLFMFALCRQTYEFTF